jgi:arylsulfatase A-like enzyme
MSMDLTATIAAAAGVKPASAEPFDGIDLAPLLANKKAEKPRDLFWRINRPQKRVRAIRSGKWKFVLDGGINNMYDLEADPGETRDLFYVHPEIAAELRGKLEAWDNQIG